MKKPPCVSLCIPTFEAADFLLAAFESAEAQTFDDLEIILSDSGSKDGTLDLIQAYRETSRFPVRFLDPPPPGMVANWNHCIDHAKGKYIKFLFQDDFLEPDCVAEMVQLAESEQDVHFVFSARHLLISEEARSHPSCKVMEFECADVHLGWTDLKCIQNGRTLLADPGLVTQGKLNKVGEPTVVLMRRETIHQAGGFNEELRQVVDLEMWWRMMACGKVGFIDRPLATFRIHPRQASVGNHMPLQVTAELKRFAKLLLNAEFADIYAAATRNRLNEMAKKNLALEFVKLQYRKPVTWLRRQLGLAESVSWKTLFTRLPK